MRYFQYLLALHSIFSDRKDDIKKLLLTIMSQEPESECSQVYLEKEIAETEV